MTRLAELVAELSSKNAGNFFLTFDIVFDNPAMYARVRDSRVITRESIAALYGMPLDDVLHVIEFDQGCSLKVAVRRDHPSGSIGETDVFGAQQYAPLLDVDVP